MGEGRHLRGFGASLASIDQSVSKVKSQVLIREVFRVNSKPRHPFIAIILSGKPPRAAAGRLRLSEVPQASSEIVPKGDLTVAGRIGHLQGAGFCKSILVEWKSIVM